MAKSWYECLEGADYGCFWTSTNCLIVEFLRSRNSAEEHANYGIRQQVFLFLLFKFFITLYLILPLAHIIFLKSYSET